MRQIVLKDLRTIRNQTLRKVQKNNYNFVSDGRQADVFYLDLQRGVKIGKASFRHLTIPQIKKAVAKLFTTDEIQKLERAYIQDLAGIFPNILATGLTPHWLQQREQYLFGHQNDMFERALTFYKTEKGIAAVVRGKAPIGFRFIDNPEAPPLKLDVECILVYFLTDAGLELKTIKTNGKHDKIAIDLVTGKFDWFNAEYANAISSATQSVINELLTQKMKWVKSSRYQMEQYILASMHTFVPEKFDQAYLSSLQSFLRAAPSQWLEPSFIDKCHYRIKAAIFAGASHLSYKHLQHSGYTGALSYFATYQPKPAILKTMLSDIQKDPEYVKDMTGKQLRDICKSFCDFLRSDILLSCFTADQILGITIIHAEHVKNINKSMVYKFSKKSVKFLSQKPYVPVSIFMEEMQDCARSFIQTDSDIETISDFVLQINQIIHKPHRDYFGKHLVVMRRLHENIQLSIAVAFCKDLLKSLQHELRSGEALHMKGQAKLKEQKIALISQLMGFLLSEKKFPGKTYLDELCKDYPKDVTEAGSLSYRVWQLLEGLNKLAPPEKVKPKFDALTFSTELQSASFAIS